MTRPVALPISHRRRGNPDWGRPILHVPILATEFEMLVKQLRLTPEMYTFSHELKNWCERNRNRVYIPEWLLEEWDISVNLNFSDAA
ncbi:MAG TPA: hypothetical protein VEI52_19635 [Terriglobales bacterium]|nr:hypothetical protein [Terriglobales bacterium]